MGNGKNVCRGRADDFPRAIDAKGSAAFLARTWLAKQVEIHVSLGASWFLRGIEINRSGFTQERKTAQPQHKAEA